MCNWTLIICLPNSLPNTFLLAWDLFWSQLHPTITLCFSRCWVLTQKEICWGSELGINRGKNSSSHSAHQCLLPSRSLPLSPSSQWKTKPQQLKPCSFIKILWTRWVVKKHKGRAAHYLLWIQQSSCSSERKNNDGNFCLGKSQSQY